MTTFFSSLFSHLPTFLYENWAVGCPKSRCPGPSHRPHPRCTPLTPVRDWMGPPNGSSLSNSIGLAFKWMTIIPYQTTSAIMLSTTFLEQKSCNLWLQILCLSVRLLLVLSILISFVGPNPRLEISSASTIHSWGVEASHRHSQSKQTRYWQKLHG